MIRFVYGVCGLFTTVMAMCAFADMTRQSNGFGVIAAGHMVREFSDEELHAACGSSVRVKTADPCAAGR